MTTHGIKEMLRRCAAQRERVYIARHLHVTTCRATSRAENPCQLQIIRRPPAQALARRSDHARSRGCSRVLRVWMLGSGVSEANQELPLEIGLQARGAGLLLRLSPWRRTEAGFLGQVRLSTNYCKYESRNEGTRPARTKSGVRGPGTNGSRHPLHHQGRGINPYDVMRCACKVQAFIELHGRRASGSILRRTQRGLSGFSDKPGLSQPECPNEPLDSE
jgi:hypothetical protein